MTLSAGALRIEGTLADTPIDASKLSLAIYVPQNRNPWASSSTPRPRQAISSDCRKAPIISFRPFSTRSALIRDQPAGQFRQIGDAAPPAAIPSNSVVNADIKVSSGKQIDVTIKHRCATLTLKLVNKPAGEALANTTFTVLTPGGDVIRELVGAFPSLVLAEGEYVVIARHESKVFQSTFQVQTGMDRDIEVVAQESGKQGP